MPPMVPQLRLPGFGSRQFILIAAAAFFFWIALMLQAVPAPNWQTGSTITSQQATTTAVNRIETLPDGLRLAHPRHLADFRADGLTFTPHNGGPVWQWELTHIGSSEAASTLVAIEPTAPQAAENNTITYERGGIVEQYVARAASVEQQFLIAEQLPLNGADLIITGAIDSSGTFETTANGWAWRNISGVVSLGNVTVIDANGMELPAAMRVTAVSTEIVVNGRSLQNAAYPVLVDPEIGTNDFQISFHGADYEFDGERPAMVYNSGRNEFFVVWEGDTEDDILVKGETEIFGQRLDAITGARLGSAIRISSTGIDGSGSHDAREADIVYNPSRNEYFVVWVGDDFNGEFEVWGQRLSTVGQLIGDNVRLSHMGPDENTAHDAEHPAVAYNSTNNQYLVVWMGDDEVDAEDEIYGQRVSATGLLVGTQIRLSDMGPDGDTEYAAQEPDVAYNSTNNEYLVVWRGDNDVAPNVNGESEVFAQRVNGATGLEVGANDYPISDMGTEGSSSYDAKFPAITYNDTNNEYFVVWSSDDKTEVLVNDEIEIFGQRINGLTGAEVGTNDLRLSQMGPDGNVNFEASEPSVAYNDDDNEYMVVWQGNTIDPNLDDLEVEIYGQIVNAGTGFAIGDDILLSDMGPNGNIDYIALAPTVAYGDGIYYSAWYGDDTSDGLLDDEFEIFGQQIDAQDGSEIGTNDRRLSSMGPLGYPDLAGFTPDIAYSTETNQYLVVWSGSDNTGELGEGEQEIFGQRIHGTSGAFVGDMIRISDMGPDGSKSFDAFDPAVTYNSENNEFFVVWSGDDDTGFLVNGESEIYGQRINAVTGLEIGTDIRLSDMGPDGNVEFEAITPDVAYDSRSNQYLVVWVGDDDTAPNVDEEFEIYGQRVAATGTQVGVEFRLSDMGPDGNTEYAAQHPAVAYNSINNEFFVVWSGDDNTAPLTNGEEEIFGQRINAPTGLEVGSNDMRLSDAGPDGSGGYDARMPDVAYNGRDNEYLVVWSGEDNMGGIVADEIEIFGQRLNALNGLPVGANDFRISHVAQDGNLLYGGFAPAVAYSQQVNEYLVIWHSDDNINEFIDDEFEVYGQRLSNEGELVDPAVQLSDMGQNGNIEHVGLNPAVAYAEGNSEYLVVWSGNDNTGAELHNGFEIFGQRFAATRTVYLPIIRK